MANQSNLAAATATASAEMEAHGSRRHITGTVTSNAMQKTVVVTVVRRIRDARFHKFVTRRLKYKAHDENNVCKVGDVVEIVEARPQSKTKRWRVLRTISHSRDLGVEHGL